MAFQVRSFSRPVSRNSNRPAEDQVEVSVVYVHLVVQ